MNNSKKTNDQLAVSDQSKTNKTNPKKVKQEIKQDLSQGQGTITALEAGHMRD